MSFGKGFTSIFSAGGIGGFLAFFLILVVLAYLGTTPSTVAASLRSATS